MFLSVLKLEKPGSGKIASGANDLQKMIRTLQRNASVSGEGLVGVAYWVEEGDICSIMYSFLRRKRTIVFISGVLMMPSVLLRECKKFVWQTSKNCITAF